MTKFLNISTDTTLGGNSPSDDIVSSQKALKTYIDNNSGASVAIDNSTITKNGSDQLQAVATVNANTAAGATNPIYDWVGTLAEYTSQAVATNHPDWICYITDDISGGGSVYTKAEVDNIFATLYPVGSIYVGTQSTCPLATIIPGSTWTLVSSGKALWTGDGTNGNTTIAAGLPNITGYTDLGWSGQHAGIVHNASDSGGAIVSGRTINGVYGGSAGVSSGNVARGFGFDASASNAIYGNSATVQPPAYVVNVWRRTA